MLNMPVKKFSAAVILAFLLIFVQAIFLAPKNVHASTDSTPPIENQETTIVIKKITPDKATTEYFGGALSFSVEAEGNDLQYKWAILNDSNEVVQEFDSFNSNTTLNWTPGKTGKYRAKVIIKDASGKTVEGLSDIYTVQAKPVPAKITKVKPDKSETKFLGINLNFSVEASGSNLQYQWIIYKDSKAIFTSSYNSQNKSLSWKPTQTGNYKARVKIKNAAGEIISNYSSEYKVLKPNPIIITKVLPNIGSSKYLGSNLNFTAYASGSNLRYKWVIYSGSKVVYTSSYSSKYKSFNWKPKYEGTYKAKVYIKNEYQTVSSTFTNQYKVRVNVNALVKPYYIPATMNRTAAVYSSASYSRKKTTFKKWDKIEKISSSGSWYYVRNVKTKTTGWVRKAYVTISRDTPASKDYMKKEHLERYVNENNYSSSSKYFIWVDIYRQRVNVFTGKKNSWKLLKTMDCVTGKNTTPTVRGTFTVKWRAPRLYSGNVVAKYKTNFYGRYYFHSILYNRSETRVVDGRLGRRLSHGCVRLSTSNAKWIYDKIPNGTKVFIY
jgi:hypothetical protein